MTAPVSAMLRQVYASASARAPHSLRACAASDPRWTGWTLAAMPLAANRGRSSGWSIWTCSIRGISVASRAPGARMSRAARMAASPIAWIVVVMPPPVARATRSRRPSGSVIQTPRRWDAGSGRSDSASMSSSRAAVRDPNDPSAKHFCQPTTRPAVGILAQKRPAAQAAFDRGRDAVVADAGMDADRQASGVGEPGKRGIGVAEVGVRSDAARIVAGDHAERDEVTPDRLDRRGQVVGRRRRDVDGDETGRPPHGPRLRGCRPRYAARGHRADPSAPKSADADGRMADPQGVVVVRPDDDAATGCHALEVVGGRPAAPAVGVPAVAFQPGVGVGQALVGRPDAGKTLVQGRART